MKDFKILKVKSGSIIQKSLSLRNEIGEYVPLNEYLFSSQIRNSRGELLATAAFNQIDVYNGYLTFAAEDTLNLVQKGRMNDVLYMDVAVQFSQSPDIIIHSETIKIEVDRGITEINQILPDQERTQ